MHRNPGLAWGSATVPGHSAGGTPPSGTILTVGAALNRERNEIEVFASATGAAAVPPVLYVPRIVWPGDKGLRTFLPAPSAQRSPELRRARAVPLAPGGQSCRS